MRGRRMWILVTTVAIAVLMVAPAAIFFGPSPAHSPPPGSTGSSVAAPRASAGASPAAAAPAGGSDTPSTSAGGSGTGRVGASDPPPPSLDGYGGSYCNYPPCTEPLSFSLSVSAAGEVIVVLATAWNSPRPLVTDSIGTAFALRTTNHWFGVPSITAQYEFWGVAPVATPADQILINYGGTSYLNESAIAFSAAGANPTQPWDAAVPTQGIRANDSQAPGPMAGATITTVNPDDLVFGLLSATTPPPVLVNSGFTAEPCSGTYLISCMAYQKVSTAGTWSPGFPLTRASDQWGFIADALTSGPAVTGCNYTITFNETGLPVGTTWDVEANGVTMSATVTVTSTGAPAGTSLTFSGLCGGGSYTYSVSAPAGYTGSPSSGTLTIPTTLPPGSEVYQTIVFAQIAQCCVVVANPVVLNRPAGEAYDPVTGEVFVSDWGQDKVSVICDGTGAPGPCAIRPLGYVVATINEGIAPGGDYPNGEAFDPITHTVWVTNWYSGNLSEICDGAAICGGLSATNRVVASPAVTCQGPYAIAYDSVDGNMTVACTGYYPTTERIVVVNAQTLTNTPSEVVVLVGSHTATTANGPRAITYDPVFDQAFVSDPYQNTVDVVCLSAVTGCGTLYQVSLIPLPAGSNPYGLAYDPSTKQVFVAEANTSSVAVIDASTSTPSLLIGPGLPISVGSQPTGVAYYAQCAEVLVTNFGSNNVSVIADATDQVVFTVPVGQGPDGIVYDPAPTYGGAKGAVFVSNYAQNAPNVGPGNVSVIFCTLCATHVTCNYTITFNETGLALGSSWDITLNGVTMTATVTVAPTGVEAGTSLTFSGLCAGGNYTYSVSAPSGYTASPSSGTLTIPTTLPPGGEVYQTIVFTKSAVCDYTITFNETGLPVGATWDIELNGVTMTATVTTTGAGTTLTFSGLCAGGNYTYSVSAPSGYTASPSSGTLTIPTTLPPGSEVYQTITFTTSAVCTYTITFNETGLPAGTTWDVELNGVTMTATVTTTGAGTSITFSGLCAGGNYTYSVSAPSGYTASPPSGTLTIPTTLPPGGEVYQTIVFTKSTVCDYTITFNETGLPAGTTWDIELNGVTMTATVTIAPTGVEAGTTLTFSGLCGGGNYTYSVSAPSGYTASPPSGTLTIPTTLPPGSEVYQTIVFTTSTVCNYTITFNETGLPYGAVSPVGWDITLNGVTINTTTLNSNGLPGSSFITFSGLCAGQNYTYIVSTPSGYTASPSSGTLTIPTTLPPGSEVYQTIVFTASAVCDYTITFNETGLAVGTAWQVVLNGFPTAAFVTSPGTGTSITFSGLCAGGNYTFTAMSPGPYTASPASGTLTIPATLPPGSEVYQTIVFTKVGVCNYTITFNETGLPVGTTWDVELNGVTTTATVTTTGAGTSITFSGLCAGGNYTYSVSAPSGYTASPSSGTLTIPTTLAPGSEVYQTIVFTTSVCNYTITFIETGLPANTSWSVEVNPAGNPSGGLTVSGTGSAITVTVPSTGAYAFTISGVSLAQGTFYSPYMPGGTITRAGISGTVTVAGIACGAEVYLQVAFKPGWIVTFTESGLPVGTLWYVVERGGQSAASTGTSLYLSLPNGTFSYVVGVSNASWTANPPGGQVTVNGAPGDVSVVFEPAFGVTFRQNGIPNGTVWSIQVTLTSTSAAPGAAGSAEPSWFANSTGPTALLYLANGTYSFLITAAGFPPTSGPSFTVHGQSQQLPAVAVSSSAPSSGVPSWIYILVGVGVAVIAIGAIALLYRRRPPKPSGTRAA